MSTMKALVKRERAPGLWLEEAEYRLHERGLARPVGAQQEPEVAGPHLERDVAQNGPARVAEPEAASAEDGRRRHGDEGSGANTTRTL